MIDLADNLPANSNIDADVCIVGGGPAAITVALELAGGSKKVVLLAGGGWREDAAGQDLHRGFADPEGSHEPLEENRRRQFGGATAAWGGRCIPFDPSDFEKRDWIPDSGWPISYHDLEPYLERANELCEVGRFSYDAREVFPETSPEIVEGLDDENIVSWPMERWGPPTHFGKHYKAQLKSAANVTVLLNAHAINFQVDPVNGKISNVDAVGASGNSFHVQAKQFVLAGGALENARLLLASNDIIKAGIGNQSDCVGRYYMSHLFGTFAVARLTDPAAQVYNFERDKEGVYCRRRWWLTSSGQEKERVGNAILFFFRPAVGQALHRDPLFSTTYLIKYGLSAARLHHPKRILKRVREDSSSLKEHLGIALLGAHKVAPQMVKMAWGRSFQKRRLPFALPPASRNEFHLFYQTEHAPNRDSRVFLEPSTKDALGLPRLRVEVAFSELDIKTAIVANRKYCQRLHASGAGMVDFDEAAFEAKLRADIRHFNSCAHQIGTTRMTENPDKGVVDRNCKVHGMPNLWIAGSSVFPTSGHANPTLMLVALAARLGERLKNN